eukprot:COSAG01_NODE_32515_length_579_cov_51.743750_1_plen_51_part_01
MEKAKQAKKQLDESEQAAAEVHKHAERTKIVAEMEKKSKKKWKISKNKSGS